MIWIVECCGIDSHRRQSEEGDSEQSKAGGQQASRPRLGSLISIAYSGQSNLSHTRRQKSGINDNNDKKVVSQQECSRVLLLHINPVLSLCHPFFLMTLLSYSVSQGVSFFP